MKLPYSSIDLGTSDAAGCISGILRRIRRRNVPKDLEQCVDPAEPRKVPPQAAAAPVPGLVARLMGLDSMPVHPSPMPDTIARSRSANSIETWRGFLAHKRTISDPLDRPTQSFRELPTYLTLTQESDEFLLLSFTPNDGGKKKEANPNLNIEELKTRTARKSRQEKKPERKSHRKQMQVVDKERHKNARKKLAHSSTEIESECSCQDLSPVSVLEHSLDTDGECSPSPETRVIVRRVQEDMKPRQRKLLSEFADRKDASLRIQNRKTSPVKKKSRQAESYSCDFAEVWALICRMADENVKGPKWVWREDARDIATEIGVEILDYLISEVVLEL